MTTRFEYLEALEGREVHSIQFEGVVMVKDGKVWQKGKVVSELPSMPTLRNLFNDAFYDEFGTDNIKYLMENE